MYDWRTELQIRAEDASYGTQTNKVCRSAIDEIDRLRAQVDRLADGQLYQDRRIGELLERLRRNADTLEVEEDHDGAALEREAATRLESLIEENARVEFLLRRMTYYAGLIVDPHAHGSIYPDKAMEELEEARDLLAALSPDSNENVLP